MSFYACNGNKQGDNYVVYGRLNWFPLPQEKKGRAALLQYGNQITRNTTGGNNFCKPPRTQVTNTTPTATVSSSMNALAFNPSRSHCSNPEQLRDLVPRVNSNAHLFYRIFVSHSADASSVTFIIIIFF